MTPETFRQVLYMETTRSIVWLAKKSETETLEADVCDRGPGMRIFGNGRSPVTLEPPLTGKSSYPTEMGSLPWLKMSEGGRAEQFFALQ